MQKNVLLRVFLFSILLFTAALFQLGAVERITKIGVIDFERVKLTFINKSKDYTQYENYKKEFDAKVASITTKINNLEAQKLEAKDKGNDTLVAKLEDDILTENEYLKEYYRVTKNQVKVILQNINNGDDFYLKLKKAIAQVSEEEGYSAVLDISSNLVLYWASDVDITDKVIKVLNKMFETK